MSFSLELTDEQAALRDKTHAFAREVIRPAASKFDREQEFPWPVIEQAAEQGLYGWELYARLSVDPTGLSLPILMEELFWGCAGIGLLDRDAGPGAGGDPPGGHRRAARALGAGVLRHPGRHQARGAGGDRAEWRQRRTVDPDPGSPGRRGLGDRRAEGVHRQRRRSPTFTSLWPPSIPRPAIAARACSSSPRAPRG